MLKAAKYIKFILDRKYLEIIYISFIRPILEYGDVIIDNCTAQEKGKLEKVQYEAARIVTGATKLVSIEKLMSDVGWESLECRREKHKLTLYYKMMNGLTPPYLSSLCPPTVSNDAYNLRNQADSQVPRARTSLYYDSFLPSTVRAYNSLPLPLRNSTSLSSFKRQLFMSNDKVPAYFYCGVRKNQILHTRLRTNCSSLAADLFSKNIIPSPICSCGQRETTYHYFFQCMNYDNLRPLLLNEISIYCPVTLETVLKGSEALTAEENEIIFLAVHCFIEKSKRFD